MKILDLSKEIYAPSAVDGAIIAFNHLADITRIDRRDSWKICFRKCKYNEKRTVFEFENYLIGLENQNGNR